MTRAEAAAVARSKRRIPPLAERFWSKVTPHGTRFGVAGGMYETGLLISKDR
jgi:hypothetical protein